MIRELGTHIELLNKNASLITASFSFIDLEYMVYMFKYDTVHGIFQGDVHHANGKLVVNGNEISVFGERVRTIFRVLPAASTNADCRLDTVHRSHPLFLGDKLALTTSSRPPVYSPPRRRLVPT